MLKLEEITKLFTYLTADYFVLDRYFLEPLCVKFGLHAVHHNVRCLKLL